MMPTSEPTASEAYFGSHSGHEYFDLQQDYKEITRGKQLIYFHQTEKQAYV